MKTWQTKRRAFTLVELLVVIAIIGILFVVLISKVDFATEKSKATGVQTDFRSYQVAIETVARENAGLSVLVDNDAGGEAKYAELEKALNKNLDSKLHVEIDADGKISTEAKDPWKEQYLGAYLAPDEDGTVKDRGAIVMFSAGKDNKLGMEAVIQDGNIVFGYLDGKLLESKDDYAIGVIYTYKNGYGEVNLCTIGFTNNPTIQVTPGSSSYPDNGRLEHNDAVIPLNASYYDASEDVMLTEGDPFPANPDTGDIYLFGDYEYRYNYVYVIIPGDDPLNEFQTYGWIPNTTAASIVDYEMSVGWGVAVRDRSKTEYNPILNNINKSPVVHLVGTFANCQNLESISLVIPENTVHLVLTFACCYNLKTVDMIIPNGVISMESAFSGCKSLNLSSQSSLRLPNSLIYANNAFFQCQSLTVAPDMSNCFNLKSAHRMFGFCEKLTSAPNLTNCSNVEDIGAMFLKCSQLKVAPQISHMTNLMSMSKAFCYCTSLEVAPVIPESMNEHGLAMTSAFSDCLSLKEAPVIPSCVTSLTWCFNACNSIQNVIEINTDSLQSSTIVECQGDPADDNWVARLHGYNSVFDGVSSTIFITGNAETCQQIIDNVPGPAAQDGDGQSYAGIIIYQP